MVKKQTETPNFEAAIKALDEIVQQMEQGGLTLEKSLEYFERGINLTRHCQQALQVAEQKIQILVEQNGKTALAEYQNPAEE